MAATTRELFLARVAAAVRAGNKYREAQTGESSSVTPANDPACDTVLRFTEELSKVGAFPTRLGTREQLAATVQQLVAQRSIRSAILNDSRLAAELDLVGMLRNAGVDVVTIVRLAELDEAARRDALFAADLGIASPDWAIAETGTLVYAADSAQTRSATLLPAVHLALVDATSIVRDLMDLPGHLQSRSCDGVLPRNVALVTGPSKTGDIELKLTTGVHGPGEVHVLIWESSAPT